MPPDPAVDVDQQPRRPEHVIQPTHLRYVPPEAFAVTLACLLAGLGTADLADQQRPLTFTDVQLMKRGGDWAPSSDGAWRLYTVTSPRLAGGLVVE